MKVRLKPGYVLWAAAIATLVIVGLAHGSVPPAVAGLAFVALLGGFWLID